MRHPFELELCDLEAVDLHLAEYITDEEAAQVRGGILPGGCVITQSSLETNSPLIPTLLPNQPPTYTSMAIGEEGGTVTTMAIGEEGGTVTTMAIGEEGGSSYLM